MALPSQALKFAGLLMIIAVSVVLFQWTDLGRHLKPEAIRDAIQSVGPLAPLLYLAIYSVAPVLSVPGWIISVAGGLAFGAVWGTGLTVLGATVGATAAFFLARYLGRDFVARALKGKLQTLATIDDQAAAHGFQVIFFLRLIPLIPFNVLNYVAGLSRVGAGDYILGTFLGIIPGTFAYVYLGSSLTHVYSWQFALAIGMLVLLAVIPILYKRWKARRRPLVE
jgi:uncharacterized membrane protein YdjX (TVP38/TMEM64 family)